MKKIKIFLIISLVTLTINKNDYYLSEPVYSDDGSIFTGILNYKGVNDSINPNDYHYDWAKPDSELLKPIKKLKIQISLECNKWLHFYVTDAIEKRWENDYSIDEKFKEKVKSCSNIPSEKSLESFGLIISENLDEAFYLKLINPLTNEIIFTTEGTDFLFTNYFIGFGGYITTNDIYGFGERMHDLKLGDGKFTIWSNDTNGIKEDIGEGGLNGYGFQPLGFHKTNENLFIGHLFNNINCQDIVIETNQDETNKVLMEHRTVGGVIDYYITVNENPNDVLASLHTILGTPTLPPFWSLGFHQCRWGYNSLDEIREVYDGYVKYDLPIDTFWGDIDILEGYRIFTLNTQKFEKLPDFIHELHDNGYKFVPIVDIGIAINNKDEFYNYGKELDCFVKSNYTNEDLVSFVWPGKVVFPDFLLPESKTLWEYGFARYYEIIKYDGIWLDMNEPAMMIATDGNRGELLNNTTPFDPAKNEYEDIPYVPGYIVPDHNNIRSKTLSENSYSKLKKENKFLDGYNFKTLMTFLENRNTNEILTKMGKRPFILSRSTLMGQQRYSFHWLGDNGATYEFMRNGVTGIYQFQIYGMPMVGDDICGFMYNSWDQLCARWSVLGAFFPFSRNHNALSYRGQDPPAWGENSKTLKSAKIALNIRYSLLRYFYTELFKVSLKETESFFKPLFFDYYNDPNTYNNLTDGILIGNAFLLYPIYSDYENDTEVYLPNDDWNYFPSGDIYTNKNNSINEGHTIIVSGKFEDINLFLKGGIIIPHQDTITKFPKNTIGLNRQNTELIINPDSQFHMAKGDIIFDDDGINTIENKEYYYIKTNFVYDTLSFYIENKMTLKYSQNNFYISKLKFFRMNYLLNEGLYDLIQINLINSKKINIPIKRLNDEKIEVDLIKYKIRFDEIISAKIFKNN